VPFSLPKEPGRRAASSSLRMVAVTGIALVAAAVVGTFLQAGVFDLEEQESIARAGVWGYVAGFSLLALISLPSVVGVVLGVRARRLGARRGGTTGIFVNALIAVYFVIPGVAYLLFG
jgi:hypothetical protein